MWSLSWIKGQPRSWSEALDPMSAVPATGGDGETTRSIINGWKGEL